MKYIKQLDSVRAIAALLVVICHWLPADNIVNSIPLGFIGVNIFFVLSGFLISKILFENRKSAEVSGTNRLFVFKNFYVRRAFRIFPVYYLVILLIIVFHNFFQAGITRGELLHSLIYTSNFYVYKIQDWPVVTGHFWSLAVEEQFYLLWPLIILFVGKKYILHAVVAFIATGMFSETFAVNEYDYTPTYTCLGAFGFGGLLAFILVYNPALLGKACRLLNIVAILSLVFLVWQMKFTPHIFLQRSAVSLITLWMLSHIVYKGPANYFSFILNSKPLLFLGKMSYGIYLYHYPMFALKGFTSPWLHLPISSQANLYITLAINFCLLLTVAWASWTFVEKPILSLKKYFPYEREEDIAMAKVKIQAA